MVPRILSLGLVAALALSPSPRAPDVSAYREPVDAIVREGLRTCGAYALLSDLCRAAPRRLAGSPGAAAAVEWARQAMVDAGMENVRLEPCAVPHWERGSVAELEVLAPEEARGERLAIAALGPSVATPAEGVAAEVVEVKSFDELHALGERARGKVVLFDRPMDAALVDTFEAYGGAVGQRWGGASEAARAGGVAALVRSMTTRIDDLPHTGSMGYEDGVVQVPAAAVSTRGAERLAELLARGVVRVRLRLDCRTLADAPSANVVGEWLGRERPEEIVVVGGHLDAWDLGDGASDDGAGCVQAIEVVRLLKALGLKPRRTVRVVLFMNEENGLRGAKQYAEAHREEWARHVLALESDRGGFSPRGFESDAGAEGMAVLRATAGLLEPIGVGFVREGDGGADVGPLAKGGVPTVGYVPDGQRYFDVHHCARDTVEQVSPRELELGACAIAGLVYVVADLPQGFPRGAGTK